MAASSSNSIIEKLVITSTSTLMSKDFSKTMSKKSKKNSTNKEKDVLDAANAVVRH